ncbi:MAG: hydroxyacylglutathione hydrolase [Limisphaerales bacterium]
MGVTTELESLLKHVFVVGLFFVFTIFLSLEAEATEVVLASDSLESAKTLRDKKWVHGSVDCDTNEDPAIEVFRYDQSSYILRQNKCLSFEAPFIYVLLGEQKALVLDTGATKSVIDFPLYDTVRSLISADPSVEREILVVHSHSHGDHYAGDSQFDGKPKVTVVEPTSSAVAEFFAFGERPNEEAYLELGGRKLVVVFTPGHQEEAISIYDPQTKWLLTGDSFYPGYIYIKNWDDYKRSIARLVSLSEARDVSAVLGAHIEMTGDAGEYYSIGTIYQPNEASLVLSPASLASLNAALAKSDKKKKIVMDDFIVAPMNAFQKAISNIARQIIQ